VARQQADARHKFGSACRSSAAERKRCIVDHCPERDVPAFHGEDIMHKNNQTVVKERIYLDQADNNLLHDEITTIDDALTRPWTVDKRYRRERNVVWVENVCNEYNSHVAIHNEIYYLSADGDLMPAKKDQQPPSLKYFKQPQKP
jgi:hypothetical protein